MQIFEIPYLWMLPDPKALFYINAFSILLFSSLMVVMCDNYFFLKRKRRWQSNRYFLPVVLIVLYLLLAALDVLPTTENTYRVMLWIVTAVFITYVARLFILRWNIHRRICAVDERTYSNSDNFPVRYARGIEWAPITIVAARSYAKNRAGCFRIGLFLRRSTYTSVQAVQRNDSQCIRKDTYLKKIHAN